MSRTKKHYSGDFKQKAVELSYARGSVKQISEELDITYSVLSRWRKESKEYGKNSFPGKGVPKQTDEQREIAQLKKQLREAQLERDILKKAISIFSESNRKKFRFIKQHKFKFPVEQMCKMFKVSKVVIIYR